jgi:hypothetical protein
MQGKESKEIPNEKHLENYSPSRVLNFCKKFVDTK